MKVGELVVPGGSRWFPVVPGVPFARWYLDHKDMDQQAQWATEFLAWYGFAFYLLQAGWDPQKGDPHGDKGRSPRPRCVFCWGESFGETLLEPQYDISHLLSNWAPFVQPALRCGMLLSPQSLACCFFLQLPQYTLLSSTTFKVFQAVASNHQSEMLRLLRKVREIFVQTDMFIMIYNSFTFI